MPTVYSQMLVLFMIMVLATSCMGEKFEIIPKFTLRLTFHRILNKQIIMVIYFVQKYHLNLDPVLDELYFIPTVNSLIMVLSVIMVSAKPYNYANAWVKVFRIIPFRIFISL